MDRSEMNRRINTLIMRGLSATEATEQARREAFAASTAAQVRSDFIQRRIAGHAAVADVERILGRRIGR